MQAPCTACGRLCADQLLTRLVSAGKCEQRKYKGSILCPPCYDAWLERENLKAISMEQHTHTRRGRPPKAPTVVPVCQLCPVRAHALGLCKMHYTRKIRKARMWG